MAGILENKIGIGALITLVIQGGAFVWWTAQQAATIEQLDEKVRSLADNAKVIQLVNMERDIQEIEEDIDIINATLVNHRQEIMVSATFEELGVLESRIDTMKETQNSLKFRVERLENR